MKRRSRARTTWIRTAQVLLLALVVHFLVLPQIGGTSRAITLLNQLDLKLVALGLGTEIASIVAYAELVRALIEREPRPSLWRTTRIMFSGLAVNNVVPSGGAAGGALAFRQLREAGVAAADAGFALGAQSIGSAVVLNALLWMALVAAVPLEGFHPLYAAAAAVGALLLALIGALVIALTRGRNASVRFASRAARFIPKVSPDMVASFVTRISDRLHELAEHPGALRKAVLWSAAHWVLDAASLWVFIAAFGHYVRPDELFIAYGIANVLAAIPITPGGLGVVETSLTVALVGFNTPRAIAGLGVATYRLVSYWLPIPLGTASYLSLRIAGRGSRERMGDAVEQARSEAPQARHEGVVLGP